MLDLLSKALISKPRHTGYLHCSTHLTDIDLHNILDYYEFPRKEPTVDDFTRVTTGTLWHDRVHEITGAYGEHEIEVTDGLPDGWTGTADLVEDTTLWDYKTAKSDVIKYLSYNNSKPLEKYIFQVSAYYHALSAMGYFLDTVNILYIPIDGGSFLIKPVQVLPKDVVWRQMEKKKSIVDAFKIDEVLPSHPGYNYELKTVKSRKVHELYQVPPKYTEWCSFIDCPCQGMTKQVVASLYFDDTYEGNKKYESIIRSKL